MKKVVPFVLLMAVVFTARAQRTCGTTDLELLNSTPAKVQQKHQAFEEWLLQKKATMANNSALQHVGGTTIYTIPVVVHIIHTGEPYGVGYNIPDEQIAAQIAALNRDFRHLNGDSVNTPAEFQPFMADIGFEFVLARRDPAGLPTTGITRTDGNRTDWTMADNSNLKSLSYWSSTNYFNIWVAPLGNGLLGWAEFPTSTLLAGVNDVADNDPLTDGVVITTRAFGDADLYPQGDYLPKFNLGRTTTHEVGHFFGLRHVWGDGGCDVDDFVADTPKTKDPYYNCPPVGSFVNSCNAENSMFMNYMEYVDDDCMNMFSLGQKDRMVIVINNSPRRLSLLTSPGLDLPPSLDLAVTAIPSPAEGTCTNQLSPTVTLMNTGTTLITEAEIALLLNNTEAARQLFALNLNPYQDTTLALPQFNLTQFGNSYISAVIYTVNGTQDSLAGNNNFTKQVFFGEVVTALNEDFTSWPGSWSVRSDAPVTKWNFSQAPNLQITNTAAVLNYYQQYSAFPDHLITPSIDLSAFTAPYLLFDYAYGELQGYADELAVVVSTDCGVNFTDTLFFKSGSNLATTQVPARFTPSGPVDWQTVVLDLSNYLSQPIQLGFIGRSDGGNNIYLDNFVVVDQGYKDISLKGMLNEAGALSSNTIGLLVGNSGTTLINTLEIAVSREGEPMFTEGFYDLGLAPGSRQTVYLPNVFQPGSQQVSFTVNFIDGKADNNSLTTTLNLLEAAEPIPFREQFTTATWNDAGRWTITSPVNTITWQTDTGGGFIYYRAFPQGNTGLHNWLVLPPLDFSRAKEAAMQFKLAYAENDLNNEVLRIWVSTNNGLSFDYLLKSLTSVDMGTAIANVEWLPGSNSDWQDLLIDLGEFTGEESVLVAFEAIDGDGNNIYIDDIEFFVADGPAPILIEMDELAVYPNPITDASTNITFNLREKQDIRVRVLDMRGQVVSDQVFTNVLNQTYPVELNVNRSGLYILQAIGPEFTGVSRIMVTTQ